MTIVYTFVPFIGFLFTNLNIAKIKRGDKAFMNKFEAFYDGLDTERSEAIFFGPLQLLIRQIFVLNCFFNTDGPLLQIYLANCLLGTVLVLQYLTWPFVANFRNKFELFMAAVTLLLSSSCVLFVEEIKEKTPIRINAQDFFIYGFMGLMLVVLVQLIGESLVEYFHKAKEMREKRKLLR